MTSLPVNDIGILSQPIVNDAGGFRNSVPGAKEGQDFMGSLKSAIETQATALNPVPSQQTVSIDQLGQSNPDTRNIAQVDRSATTGRTGRDDSSVRNEVRKETKRETKKDAAENTDAETVSPETAEAIGEKAQEIVEEVSEELGVTAIEVLTAMDNLDMSMTDLLDPSNMTDLVTEIAGEEDAVSLLTDENLYQILGNLQEYVTEANSSLMEELDLSQEALNEVLDQTEELIGQPLAEESIPAGEVMTEDEVTAEPKEYKVTTTVDGERVSLDVEVDNGTGVASVTGVGKESSQPGSGDSSDSGSGRGRSSEEEVHGRVSEFTQTIQSNTDINNIGDFAQAVEETAGFRSEATEIANQIMDSMKAGFSQDITELEMSLHPASLGNVRVNLQSQGGQITAQFIAQNETVRAAIESQIVQLRETLEEQGVKVEAVEVTVASHEFDRGSDTAGQHQDEAAREAARAGSRRTRRIDLNAVGDDEALDEMEDADRIAAEMMEQDGNTVDYTA